MGGDRRESVGEATNCSYPIAKPDALVRGLGSSLCP